VERIEQFTEIRLGIMASVEREDLGRRSLPVASAIDMQTQALMRAPDDLAASFAFEAAVDERAYSLGEDPLELRLRSGAIQAADNSPACSLTASLRRGAALFGWSRRSREPGSMRDSQGGWIGLGVAVGTYKIASEPLLARVRLNADGSVEASIYGREIDQGIRVAIALVLAERLGADFNRIQITIGEMTAPPRQATGESGSAPAAAVAHAAAEKIRAELIHLAATAAGSPLWGAAAQGATFIDSQLVLADGRRDTFAAILRRAGRSHVDSEIQLSASGQGETAPPRAPEDAGSLLGPTYPDPVALSFAAYFAEVRLNRATRQIRVAKALGVLDCRYLVSTDIARTQALAGLVWGVGAALSGRSQADLRFRALLGVETVEDRPPVNVDIQNLMVEFINEPDPKVSGIGAEALGEAASVGTSAAIANAIYHATGKRRWELPIRADDLFETR
jgi:xanthine dehydrogenase YagR molybdenum-binding subunit